MKLRAIMAALLVTSIAAEARAEDTGATCAEAANAGQALRRAGRLRAARESFVTCARDACPEAIRARCAPWLSEIEAAMPTVVVRARDADGHDIVGVRVRVDGELLGGDAGLAVPIDPGTRRFQYESPGGDVVGETVIVTQGEKNRILAVTFRTPVAVTPSVTPSVTPEQRVTPEQPAAGRVAADRRLVAPGVAYTVGVTGLGLLGVFAYLEAKSWSDYFKLKDGCATTSTCSRSDVDAVRTKRDLAAVALGVGVAAVAASAFLLLWRSGGGETRAALTPFPGGGLLEVRGRL